MPSAAVSKCEWCGQVLAQASDVMHEECFREREAEWRSEHEKESRYGA